MVRNKYVKDLLYESTSENFSAAAVKCTFQIFLGKGVSGSEDRGGGDNSIQFINIGRVVTKVLKNGDEKQGSGRVGDNNIFDFFMLLARQKMPL